MLVFRMIKIRTGIRDMSQQVEAFVMQAWPPELSIQNSRKEEKRANPLESFSGIQLHTHAQKSCFLSLGP